MISLFILAGVLANLEVVQTWMAKKVTQSLSETLDVPVELDRVYLRFLNSAELDGLYIEDLHGDTLLYVEEFRLTIGDLNFSENTYSLRKIAFNGLIVKLKRYADADEFDFKTIVGRISTSESSGSSELNLNVSGVQLSKSSFFFSDETNKTVPPKQLTKTESTFGEIRIGPEAVELTSWIFNSNTKNGQCLVDASGVDFRGEQLNLNNTEFKWNRSFLNASGEVLLDSTLSFMRFPLIHLLVDPNDLSEFVDVPECLRKIELRGELKKDSTQIVSKGIDIRYGPSSRLVMEGLLDLPRKDSVYYDLVVFPSRILSRDLQVLESYIETPIPERFISMGVIGLQGDVKGGYQNLDGTLSLTSPKGNFSANIDAFYEDTILDLNYTGDVHFEDFDFGFFTGIDDFQTFSADLTVDGKGIDPMNYSSEAAGEIREICVRGVSINSIILDGQISSNEFIGTFDLTDGMAEISFEGAFRQEEGQQSFSFESDVRMIDLHAFGLYERDSIAYLSTYCTADFTGGDVESFRGEVDFTTNTFETSMDYHFIDDIYFSSFDSASQRYSYLESDIVEGSLIGSYTFKELFPSVLQTAESYLGYESEEMYNSSFDLELSVTDADPITRIFVPELELGVGTEIELKHRSQSSMLWGRIIVPFVGYKNYAITGGQVGVARSDLGLQFTQEIEQFSVSDQDLQSFYARELIFDERVNYEIQWNPDSTISFETFLSGELFQDSGVWRHTTSEGWFLFKDSLWMIEEGLRQSYGPGKQLTIDSLLLFTPTQSLGLSGRAGEEKGQVLNVWFNNTELGFINHWIKDKNTKLSGKINGQAEIFDLFSMPYAISDLDIDSLYFNKDYLGSLLVGTNWKESDSSITLQAKMEREGINSLDLNGNMYPFEDEFRLKLGVTFEKFKLYVLSNYTKAFLTDLKGFVDGNVDLEITPKRSSLLGRLELNKTSFQEPLTNVRYNFEGSSVIDLNDDDGIFFDNIKLRDTQYGTHGAASGSFKHDNLKDWSMDLAIDVDEMYVLNTNSSHSSYYYGTIWASGGLRISGPFNDLKIDIDAKSEEGSKFSLPLASSSEVGNNSFVTFVSKDERSGLAIEEGRRTKVNSGFEMDLRVQADEGTDIELIYDETVGDILRARGKGDIRMTVNKEGSIEMFGEYIVDEGDYLFTLQNLLNKRFIMQRGGKIEWTGDPYDANLDVTATYKLRTNLKPLAVSDSTRRYWVYVDLKMANKLSRPTIEFDVRIPDANRSLQQEIEDVIKATNDEINRQVFSLLVMNSFLTPEYATGNTNSYYLSDGVSANSVEILSNQLSHWVSKLSDDFDIGVNYESGGQDAPDQVELALSTQLFDDRISINGNVGVPVNSPTTSQVVGDVEVEAKVSRDGNFRVKVFNRSTQWEPLDNRYGYMQGVGVVYQASFSNFEELKEILFKKNKEEKPVDVPSETEDDLTNPEETNALEEVEEENP